MISKKTLLSLHSWVGLKLSLLMFIVCFTGTFAVISYELDWLFNEDLRISSQNEKDINWDAIHLNVKKTFPHRKINSITPPLYPNFASIVTTEDPELGIRRIFVNPYTGKVRGDLPYYASFQRTLRDLHRYLLAPVGGIYIVGPLGIILLISVISALLFYKKWWQGFFKLRLSSGPRAFWGSLHKVLGLWSLWFILLMGITGTWYLAERIIGEVGIKIQHKRVSIPAFDLKENNFFEDHIKVSQAITTAKKTIPNFKPAGISLATNQSKLIYVSGYTNTILVRPRSNAVFINPITGDVVGSRVTKDQSALSIWIDIADPLHFGSFSGLAVKLIWFFFGMLLCLISATGIIIFVKRIQNRKQNSWLKNILGGMKYLTFLILMIPIFFGTVLILYSLNKLGYVEHNHQMVLTPSTSTVNFPKVILYISDTEEKKILRLKFNCQKCIPKKHKAELVLNNDETIKFKKSLNGYRGSPSAFIEQSKFPLIKHISLEDNEGNKILLHLEK